MLKPIVEHVDGRADDTLRHRGGHRPLFVNKHRGAGRKTRHQERFVAAAIDVRDNMPTVADDDHAVHGVASAVAAAQDGRILAGGQEKPRHERGDWRLAAPSHRQVADAHDGYAS